jgi:hypothetical protein
MICYGELIIKISNELVVFRNGSALLINAMLEVDAISPFPKNVSRALLYRHGKQKMKFKYSTKTNLFGRNILKPIFADSKFNFEHNEKMLNKSNEEFSIMAVCNETPNYIALLPNDIYITYKYLETSKNLIQLHHRLKQLLLPDIAPLIMISLLEILRTDISTYKVIEPY